MAAAEYILRDVLLVTGSPRSILVALDAERAVTLPEKLVRYDRTAARCGEKITVAMPLWLARDRGLLSGDQ